MKVLSIAAIALALVAIAVAIIPLASEKEKDGAGGADLSALRGELAALRKAVDRANREKADTGELAALRAELSPLAARMDELAAARKESPAPPPAPPQPDEELLRSLIREQVRTHFTRRQITANDLPDAVRAALNEAVGEHTLGRVKRDPQRDGRVRFEIDAQVAGRKYDLRIRDDGHILEADIPPARTPRAAREAVLKIVDILRITRVRLDSDNDVDVVRIEGRAATQRARFKLTRRGEMIEYEVPPAYAPQAVKEACQETVPGMVLTEVRLERDDDEGVYRVDGRIGRAKVELKLLLSGEVLEAKLPPAFAPQAIREAAAAAVAGIQLTEVRKDFDNDQVVFDVEGWAHGERVELKISTTGELLEAKMPAASAPEALRAVAVAEVEGIELRSVRLYEDDGRKMARFEGAVGGDKFEIRMTAAGDILHVEVPLARVPKIVMAAARKVSKIAEFRDQIERKTDDGVKIYEMRGKERGRDIEIRITAEGKVIEVDREGGEDEPHEKDAAAEPRPVEDDPAF